MSPATRIAMLDTGLCRDRPAPSKPRAERRSGSRGAPSGATESQRSHVPETAKHPRQQRCPVGLVLGLTLGVLLPSQVFAADGAQPPEQPPTRLLIAALPFQDASPDGRCSPLAEAAGDLLVSLFDGAAGLAFVERQALDKVLREREVQLSGLAGDDRRRQVGRFLGATHILTGSVSVVDSRMRIDTHLLEVPTTRVPWSSSAEGTVGDALLPLRELAQKLAAATHLELPPCNESQIDPAPQANLHFLRGLGFHHARMPDHALVEFMRVLSLQPGHDQARFWLGAIYFQQHEYAHARIELTRFLKQAEHHPRRPDAERMLRDSPGPTVRAP